MIEKKVETGADNEQWEISHEGLFHNLKNNKYLEVSGGDLVKKTITTNKLNKPYTNNQIWNHTYIDNNKFIIKTSLNSNLALVPALDSRLTLVNYNVNDTLQHWSFKSSLEECPNNCSKNGICSFSTGLFL